MLSSDFLGIIGTMASKHPLIENKIDPALLVGDSPFRDRLLVATPALQADAFFKSVVYICAHSKAGAMGLIVNQKLPAVDFKDLLAQLSLPLSELKVKPAVHFGGPVETGRGFVLHTTDFLREDTVRINPRIGITGTVDILRAITNGTGPHNSIFALGYAGWGPGQLEAEMRTNAWLTLPADDDIIFNHDLAGKWDRALLKMGITPYNLSAEMGRA